MSVGGGEDAGDNGPLSPTLAQVAQALKVARAEAQGEASERDGAHGDVCVRDADANTDAYRPRPRAYGRGADAGAAVATNIPLSGRIWAVGLHSMNNHQPKDLFEQVFAE